MSQDTSTQFEEWRDIPGYEGMYQVSNLGQVRSIGRTVTRSDGQVHRYKGNILRTPLNQRGYQVVNLCIQGKCQMRTVHSLVAETFIGTRPEGMEVCHNDGSKTNNHVDNLRYGTSSENKLDNVRHGTHTNAAKTHCPLGHELFAENIPPSIAKLGKRTCLACSRARRRVHRHPELKPQLQALADSYYQSILTNPKKEDKQ